MSDATHLAERYFELSNARRLADIKELFTPSSTYSSMNTGVHLGADGIMGMQETFFASFESLNWDVHSMEEVEPGIVLFGFTFSGVTLEGESVHRSGWEYVVVYSGKLQHVEVRSER